MANYEEAARKFAEALEQSGMSADQAAKAIRQLSERTKEYTKASQDGAKSVKSFSAAFDGYDKSLEKVGHGLRSVYEGMKTAFLGGTGAALVKRLGEYQKGLYDLSRQATATGQTFAMFSRSMEEVGKKTSLSREESAKFLKQVQDNTKGIKLMSDEISDVAKMLSDEFGPALEDISNGFKTLSEIQQKDIFIFQRLKEGMKGPELSNYVTSMMLSHKLTREQSDTLMRINRQKVMGAAAVDEETKKLRKFQDVQQRFQQAFSNLAVSLGKPLMEVFIQVIQPLTKFGDKLGQLMEKSKGFASMIGGTAKILAWSAIAATIVAAISALASKLSGAFQLIKSVVGMGANMAPVKVWVMNALGMGGAPETVAKTIAGGGGGGFFSNAVESGKKTISSVTSAPKRLYEGAKGAARTAGTAIVSAPSKIASAVSAAGGVGGAAMSVGAGAVGVLGKIAAFLGPIGLVVAALTALASIILPMIGGFDKVGKILGMTGGEIDKINAQFAEMKEVLANAGGEIWNTLKEVGKSIITAMMPMVKMWGQVVPPLVRALTPMISSLIKAVGSIMGAMMRIQAAMMKIIMPLVTVTIKLLAGVLEKLASLIGWLADVISSAIDTISPVFDWIGEKITEFGDALMNLPIIKWFTGGSKRGEDEKNKRNMESIEKTKIEAAGQGYKEFYAKEMGVEKESVDVNKEADRIKDVIKKVLGKSVEEGLKDKKTYDLMKTDVRLRKVGIDIAKPEEAIVGTSRLGAIQQVLEKELAKRRAGGESEEGQKAYRSSMEMAAVQGNTMIMSKAMQEALSKSSKDSKGAVAGLQGAPADVQKLMAGMKPEEIERAMKSFESGQEAATLLLQQLRMATEQFQAFSQIADTAKGLLSENAEAALQIGNNSQLYTQYLTEALDVNSQQLQYAKDIALLTREGLETTRQQLRAQYEQAKAVGDVAKMKTLEADMATNTQNRAENQNRISKALNEQLKISMQLIEFNKMDIEVRESEISLLESQMNLSKQLYAGMGPTLAMQGQILSKIEDQIADYERQNEVTKRQIADLKQKGDVEGGIPTLQKKILDNENKMTQAKIKQVELTKSLRDQYLEAITSFTQMEGAFSKFIITRESGIGEAMRQYNVKGGYGLGTKGAGATNPLMQWTTGGGLQFQPMQQMMNFFKQTTSAAGYQDWPQMVPFGGWAEQMPAGSSGLQNFNPATSGSMQQNQMTRMGGPGKGGGAGEAKGPALPLEGGLATINETLNKILAALTGSKDAIQNNNSNESKEREKTEKRAKDTKDEAVKIKARDTKREDIEKQALVQQTKVRILTGMQHAIAVKYGSDQAGAKAAIDKIVVTDQMALAEIEKQTKGQEELEKAQAKIPEEQKKILCEKGLVSSGGTNFGDMDVPEVAKKVAAAASATVAEPKAAKPVEDANVKLNLSIDKWTKTIEKLIDKTDKIGKKGEAETGKEPAPEGQLIGNKKSTTLGGGAIGQTIDYAYKDQGGQIDKAANTKEAFQRSLQLAKRDQVNTQLGADRAAMQKMEMDKQIELGDSFAGSGYQGTQEQIRESLKTNPDYIELLVKVAKQDAILDEIEKNHKEAREREGKSALLASNKNPGVSGHAAGGLIPGYGRTDDVPALLTKGEYVINADAAKAYTPLLHAINAQKFASGGPVIPKTETALAGGGGGHPRVNINVRGDSAAAIKKVVMEELDATLDATMTPTGSHARLYDPTL